MTDNIATDGTDSKISVVLVVRDTNGTYAPHAAVVMASIFANTRSEICVYIIHDDTLTQENMSKLRQTADSFGQEVQFINAENILAERNFGAGKLAQGGHRGKLLKLLIPELIDAPKVIYLDCDIVVNLDLSELWAAPMGGKSIGAVNDVWSLERCAGKHRSWRRSMVWKAMSIDESSYFNSGVLVMDLDKIRARYDLTGEAAAFYKRYGKITTLTDQDFFNHIFARDTRILDEKFNRIDFSDIDEQNRGTLPCVWHMASDKPWESYTRPGIDELYWLYLTRTPWGAGKKDLIGMMLEGLASSQYAHPHSKDCVKRLKRQIADNIFRAHIWIIPRLYFILLANKFSKITPPPIFEKVVG